jgi:hypothetical protein
MRYFIWSLLTLLSFYVNIGTVSAISLEMVDKLDITAIKSINLLQNQEEFQASVVVQFSSLAESALKFKQADFAITFKDRKGTEIYLGTTQSEELVFPASKDGNIQLVDEKLNVFVGKNEAKTIERLIQLFNLLGDPDAEFEMILSGTTEVGTRTKRGWIYQGKVELEDFIFNPTIQREVLFK